jgi:hypothetical protein
MSDVSSKLGIRLGFAWNSLVTLDAEKLALIVAHATMKGDTSETATRAKLLLQFAVQAQALDAHQKRVAARKAGN